MNYETFLLRSERWDRLEHKLDQLDQVLTARGSRRKGQAHIDHEALERVVLDYRRTLSDFAIARSRFRDTWAARRLALLVGRANHRLRSDSNKTPGIGAVIGFYRVTFPRLFRTLSSELMLCVALFLVAILLGVGLATLSPDAGATFLGPDAIAGLERGEIWTDAIRGNGPFVSAAIASNNMKVAMVAWTGGLVLGLGSLYVVFFNGMMLGIIMATTVHFSMHGALLEFISAHGPLELTLILVAGAAGLHMGRAMLADGDMPRMQRLSKAGQRSVMVLVGCLPFFVVLGLVEAFLSPSPALSIELKLALGLALELTFLAVALRPVVGMIGGEKAKQRSDSLRPLVAPHDVSSQPGLRLS